MRSDWTWALKWCKLNKCICLINTSYIYEEYNTHRYRIIGVSQLILVNEIRSSCTKCQNIPFQVWYLSEIIAEYERKLNFL